MDMRDTTNRDAPPMSDADFAAAKLAAERHVLQDYERELERTLLDLQLGLSIQDVLDGWSFV
jgi:hypothetical protein